MGLLTLITCGSLSGGHCLEIGAGAEPSHHPDLSDPLKESSVEAPLVFDCFPIFKIASQGCEGTLPKKQVARLRDQAKFCVRVHGPLRQAEKSGVSIFYLTAALPESRLDITGERYVRNSLVLGLALRTSVQPLQ